MRQRDLHILTSGLHTYTNDWRISAVHVTVRQSPSSSHSVTENGVPPPMSTSSANSFTIRSRNSSSSSTASDSTIWDGEEGVWSEWTLVIKLSPSYYCKKGRRTFIICCWHTQRIRSTEARDAGLYECQVSTEPKISKIYRLHVVGKLLLILLFLSYLLFSFLGGAKGKATFYLIKHPTYYNGWMLLRSCSICESFDVFHSTFGVSIFMIFQSLNK